MLKTRPAKEVVIRVPNAIGTLNEIARTMEARPALNIRLLHIGDRTIREHDDAAEVERFDRHRTRTSVQTGSAGRVCLPHTDRVRLSFLDCRSGRAFQ